MLNVKSVLRIATPPYFFQPQQIAKRIWREVLWRSGGNRTVKLPWGLPIIIDPKEAIGYNIFCQGLYEVGVSEALWRLTAKGDTTVDAGANMGYTTSILAVRAGSTGKVICFEPHPLVFESLRNNVENWKKNPKCASFALHCAALGPTEGAVVLRTDAGFNTNKGTSYVQQNEGPDHPGNIQVNMTTLNKIMEDGEKIGVLKMDVQGFELGVLQGMERMLQNHSVRDIVFEETGEYPAPTHQYLKSKGYSIFGLEEGFWRVRTIPDAAPRFDPVIGPIPNYLATVDLPRAARLLSGSTWQSFGLFRRSN
jgi:FkbM family methyltransferase